MNSLRIKGGRPIGGTIDASGNKNAALPMIAAAMLTDQPVVLENLPDIGDVRTMLEAVEALGATVQRELPRHRVTIIARNVSKSSLPKHLAGRIRAGILFAAPLLHRLGRATMAPPGGDVIGRRRLDTHFYALERLGTKISVGSKFSFTAQRLVGADLFLPEASVTGTAQALLAATRAEGETTLKNAACEPHIQDLCHMLNAMGAQISGIGSNTLHILGVPQLSGATARVGSDFAEVGSLLAIAAMTQGDLRVTGIDPNHYRMIRRVFHRLGIDLTFDKTSVHVASEQQRCVRPPPGQGMTVIDDGIWPQFPSDLMSVMIVLATQVSGTVLFFEKMYESRMYFIDRLVDMGANAVICDPHRAVIAGPSPLCGISLPSPDIRAGIALVGAALCARGTSEIRNVDVIDRGYRKLDERLRALGADITRQK